MHEIVSTANIETLHVHVSKPLRLLYSLIIYEIVNFSFFTLYSLLLLSFFLYLKSVPIYVIVHVHVQWIYTISCILVPLHRGRRLLYIMLVRKVIMRQYNCYWRREQIPMYKIR